MEDRNTIYYPVHLTPGYEAAINSNKHQSDVSKNLIYVFAIVITKAR